MVIVLMALTYAAINNLSISFFHIPMFRLFQCSWLLTLLVFLKNCNCNDFSMKFFFLSSLELLSSPCNLQEFLLLPQYLAVFEAFYISRQVLCLHFCTVFSTNHPSSTTKTRYVEPIVEPLVGGVHNSL